MIMNKKPCSVPAKETLFSYIAELCTKGKLSILGRMVLVSWRFFLFGMFEFVKKNGIFNGPVINVTSVSTHR